MRTMRASLRYWKTMGQKRALMHSAMIPGVGLGLCCSYWLMEKDDRPFQSALGSSSWTPVLAGMLSDALSRTRANIWKELRCEAEKNGAGKSLDNLDVPLSRYSFSSAAEKCAPCVVNIMCGVNHAWSIAPAVSGGSGFILTEDGVVVTNAHVVANCREGLVVTLETGEKLPASIIAMDSQTDIAVIQVKATRPLPVAKIGTSGTLRPGEWVIALGSPLMLANSVTAGILSSVARPGSELGLRSATEFLQTDASINQGNSGGPLIDLDGFVVGVCSLKAQGTDGISFAIPIDTTMHVVNQLRTKGKVIRPYVGIKLVTVDRASYDEDWNRTGEMHDPHSRHFGGGHLLQHQENLAVMVVMVMQGSPAEKAGIQSGDIILKFHSKSCHTASGLLNLVGAHTGNGKVEVVVKRRGVKKPLHLNLLPEAEK